jgi:hypothetical protein
MKQQAVTPLSPAKLRSLWLWLTRLYFPAWLNAVNWQVFLRPAGQWTDPLGSATLCVSRWTQGRRRQFHCVQNRRKHRARLLTEKALRSRGFVRPGEEKVGFGPICSLRQALCPLGGIVEP